MAEFNVMVDEDIVEEFADDLTSLGLEHLEWRNWLKSLEDYLAQHGPYNSTRFLKSYGRYKMLGCTLKMWIVTYTVLSPTKIALTSLLIDASRLPK